MKDLIYKIDAFGEKIIGFIYNKNKFLDKLMIAITLSGDLGIIWIIISFFLFSPSSKVLLPVFSGTTLEYMTICIETYYTYTLSFF